MIKKPAVPWLSAHTLVDCWLALGLAGTAIVLLANHTLIDLTLADAVFDWQQHAFRYQHHPLLDNFMHVRVKQAMIVLLLALCVLWAWPSTARPHWLHVGLRQRLGLILLLALSSSLLVSALKRVMPHACPWALQRYGGQQPWAPTFAWSGHGVAGHCFPAGHATTALWLCGACILWLPHAPRRAAWGWLVGLSIGMSLGVAQQLRGAHFLSHTLTSMWIVNALLLVLFSVSRARL